MSKFFVPTSWENLADAMKFRSKVSLGPTNGDIKKAQAINTKLKRKKSKKTEEPNLADTMNSKASKLGKVKSNKKNNNKPNNVLSGRITKSYSNKNQKPQTKLLIAPVPSLALPRVTTSFSKLKPNKKNKHRLLKQSLGGGDEAAVQASNSKGKVPPEFPKEEVMNIDNSITPNSSKDIGLKVFENSLKQQLLPGRFRYINEQLYTMDSTEAEEMFKADAEAFEAYHAGYKQQVEKWPMNPLDRIIKMIKRLPKTLEIADFGCGEGRLAMSIPNKVYSMDLVSTRADIIACDMAITPLTDQSVDIAVYCLSLMGTNLKDYLLEANRVLRLSGFVLIAEIQSRFDDVRNFVRGLQACGFELVKKDIKGKLFYFFHLKKVRNVGKVAIIPPFSLKPCLYRKR